MTDPAIASSQLYHAAFQNTLTKAMVFIDRQLQGWTPMTKEIRQHQNRYNSNSTIPTTLEQPLSDHTTTPSLMSESYTSSLYTNQQYDNDNDDNYSLSSGSCGSSIIQTPVSLSPPPYFTAPSKSNQPQLRSTRPRPVSMPILSPPPQQQQQQMAPPPHYGSNSTMEEDDPYTRATQKWQNRRSIAILPREEEGKEDLPAYHCSIYKMAKVNMKMELCMSGKWTRSWR
jgi:hypothetical protein